MYDILFVQTTDMTVTGSALDDSSVDQTSDHGAPVAGRATPEDSVPRGGDGEEEELVTAAGVVTSLLDSLIDNIVQGLFCPSFCCCI